MAALISQNTFSEAFHSPIYFLDIGMTTTDVLGLSTTGRIINVSI